jgi:hypothetical protein
MAVLETRIGLKPTSRIKISHCKVIRMETKA